MNINVLSLARRNTINTPKHENVKIAKDSVRPVIPSTTIVHHVTLVSI